MKLWGLSRLNCVVIFKTQITFFSIFQFSNPAVLETYTAFVNNWSKAKDAIRTAKLAKPAFSKFLEEKARENRGKLSLDALLIKIIQKFPK